MEKIFFIGAIISMMAVLGSLLFGLLSMGKNTKKANKLSNKMMRMRILFQGLAIIFLFASYFSK